MAQMTLDALKSDDRTASATKLVASTIGVLVGLFGMIQTYWLGPVLLVLHNVEILADSMVYAGVLALLFVRKEPSELAAAGNFVMA